MDYTDYQLSRWRRYLLLRDSRAISQAPNAARMSICGLCGPQIFYHIWQVQAHHIRPKALYPELALQLSNGILLCAGHHQGIVHNHNPARDVTDVSPESGWRHYLSFFVRWNRLTDNKQFNLQHQSKLTVDH